MSSNPNPAVPFNREDLAWAAGFFDGEGSFSCHTSANRLQPSASVGQVRKEPLERLARILGGKVRGPYHRPIPEGMKTAQPRYDWSVNTFEQVQAVVALLWSWLSEPKREDAVTMLTTMRIHLSQPAKGSSRYKGVSLHKQSGKWASYLTHDGQRIHVGLFTTEEDAAHARLEKYRELIQGVEV